MYEVETGYTNQTQVIKIPFSDASSDKRSPRQGYLVLDFNEEGLPRSVLVEGVLNLGRSRESDVVVLDDHASARHCQIEKRPMGYFIRDLKSRNGTFVNGTRINEAPLEGGELIQLGQKQFLFQLEAPSVSKFSPLTSKNPAWAETLKSVKHIGQNLLPVFLQGESGTGKEVFAKIIHDLSSRSQGPFICVNCSALTETLVESELFGHIKGSFTGATNDRKGAFEAARGGTLFLDEIGDLPLSLQPKLLRALENKEIRPVGSDKAVKTDVRIITATHKGLEDLVSEGQFRADLFYRIHVVKLSLPALRDRLEDLPDLIEHFTKEYKTRFSEDGMRVLRKHSWPGNIRELKNTVARASALHPGRILNGEYVSQLLDTAKMPIMGGGTSAQIITQLSSFPFMKNAEKDLIHRRLIFNKGNQRKTAAELGIPKSTLHDKIRRYQIDVDSITNLDRLKVKLPDAPAIENMSHA